MSKRTTNSHKNFEEKDAFGRPINHSIELPFIQHLRKKKFPCINSESLVEICCNKYKPKVKRISSDSGEDDSLDTIRFLRNWFKKIDENYFGQLWSISKDAVQRWEPLQVLTEKDLPKHYFLDGCDLSYLILEIIKQRSHLRNELTASELLFLQLFSHVTRDSIPLCVLKTLEKKYDFIMMKMEGFMRPIREIEAWEKNEDDNISLSAKENIIFQFIKQSPIFETTINDVLYDVEPEEEKQEHEPKSKKIHKAQSNKKEHKKRPKSDLLTEQQINPIIEKIMAHMLWSYCYVYSEVKIQKIQEEPQL